MLKTKKINEAKTIARSILDEYNLKDWNLSVNNSYENIADTVFRTNTIRISRRFIHLSDRETFNGVVLHEAAHALLPYNVGHGPEFIELCINISGNPDYAQESFNMPIGKYMLSCESCDWRGTSNYAKEYIGKNLVCKTCKSRVTVCPNIIQVVPW